MSGSSSSFLPLDVAAPTRGTLRPVFDSVKASNGSDYGSSVHSFADSLRCQASQHNWHI